MRRGGPSLPLLSRLRDYILASPTYWGWRGVCVVLFRYYAGYVFDFDTRSFRWPNNRAE